MIKDKITLVQGDITDADTDAIVNAANTALLLGSGVAGAIRRKGGPQIQAECDRIGPIPLGEAAVTGGGKLRARYVIHAAAMHLGGTVSKQALEDATRNSLRRADEKGCTSIAFPAIGTGVGGYGIDACARDMLRVVYDYLRRAETGIEEVRFVLFDRAGFEAFQREHNKLPQD